MTEPATEPATGPENWVRLLLGTGALVGLLAGSLAGCGAAAEAPDPAPTGPDLAAADLWLSFDGDDVGPSGAPVFPDAAGGAGRGTVVAAGGGTLERVAGAHGSAGAVRFPERCDVEPCPRVLVEVAALPELDPGEHDFEYGATVRLEPTETTVGSNLVQKGRFGTTGGQWKLQVDGRDGAPSCVVRGDAPEAQPVVARSHLSLADGAWHVVVCRRDAEGVSISVDGEVDRTAGATGSVSNDAPLRVGAPGVGVGDDQFHGRLDDVYLAVDAG